MILKKDVKEGNKPTSIIKRVINATILVLILFLFSLGLGFVKQQEQSNPHVDVYQELVPSKYELRVSNSIGGHTYYCDSYQRDNNTYKLFDPNGKLINEITITPGYVVEIKAK